jgi:hypothetical protein
MLGGWPLNRFPGLIEHSAQLIHKYGMASVFLAARRLCAPSSG